MHASLMNRGKDYAIGNSLLVGLTLAVVVLPQAIAFSTTLAGLPPYFGIYAAIWGVLFTALLNPSRIFHGGPNSAMSAVIGVTLLPVAPQFGNDYIGYALSLILMAGVFQLLFLLIPALGRMLDFLSEPVINGMICGIGLFLIFKSFAGFAGLPINTEVEWPLWIAWQTFLAMLEIGNMHAIHIGLVTLVVTVLARQFQPIRNAAILLGIIAGTLLSEYLNSRYGLENTLIEQTADMSAIGFVFPSIPLFTQEAMPDLISIIPGAITLALLGLFQTVAAMRRMNRKQGRYISARHGIFADSLSNCLLPFISSLPTCASFNRMWLMHAMGAVSRLAAVFSGLILLLLVLFFSDLIAIIPIPAMAATIMIVGANMIKWSDIKPHFHNVPEAIVFSTSFISVHIFGLFGAVICGSLLALAYAKWEKAHPNVSLDGNTLRIKGNIYYGSLPVIESLFHKAINQQDELVVDFSAVHHIDPEGVRWLAELRQHEKVRFMDRRSGMDRRTGKRVKHSKTDRRQRRVL
ncbi:SulP family inorganic anion transporter [Marinobacterium sedimentorum]|uniref:SulP family inorganic anion transporter n=1 Tax=Marinobacterium sedimentorum TaxID=2927804 RepID=UPI0020C65CEC|nr:SulP family inorganic anion transporter [Marinobacterium sedimentorum]MCP8688762.1 SulP family inorganic anion transporter [Marinobacterium sedimentorum]